MPLSPTAARAVAAYGGEARWRAAATIDLRVSAYGAAFRWKWRAAMVRVRATLDVHRPYVRLVDERRGTVGVLDGFNVHLEDPDAPGRVLARRENARAYFPYGRRLFYWDELDHTYFASYALWNYVTLPALLMRDDIAWTEVRPGILDARFPAGIPTHSRQGRFHFDLDTGRLRQYDYTADVFGGWAKGAHVVLAHDEIDGVVFTSHRRVTPRRADGAPARLPLLVDVRLEEFRLRADPRPQRSSPGS